MPIDIWFVSSVEVAQSVPTIVSAWSKNRVFDLWTVVCDHNINSSIEVWLSGNSSFYQVCANHGPDRYILYREGSNWSIQTEGWRRKFRLQLLSNFFGIFLYLSTGGGGQKCKEYAKIRQIWYAIRKQIINYILA